MVATHRFTRPDSSIRRFAPGAAPSRAVGPDCSLCIRSVGSAVALCASDPRKSEFGPWPHRPDRLSNNMSKSCSVEYSIITRPRPLLSSIFTFRPSAR